jgi:hypothetical protein
MSANTFARDPFDRHPRVLPKPMTAPQLDVTNTTSPAPPPPVPIFALSHRLLAYASPTPRNDWRSPSSGGVPAVTSGTGIETTQAAALKAGGS